MVKKQKLYERLYNDLRGRIKSGNLKNGDLLPTEQELGIVGIDNIRTAADVHLSTVSQDLCQMGGTALDGMLK